MARLECSKALKRAILTMAICMLAMTACTSLQSLVKPDYQLQAVSFKEIDLKKLRLEVKLKVDNPNYMALKFSKVEYDLWIDNQQVLQGLLKDGIVIPAHDSLVAEIPMEVELSALASGAVALMLNKKIDYVLKLNLTSDILILNKKVFLVERSGVLEF